MSKSVLEPLRQITNRLTPRQRTVLVGGTLFTLLLLAALVKTFAAPEYKPLMTGMEPADAQALSAELAGKKIDYQLTADGKGINVAANELDKARMEIVSEGPVHSGRIGFELFDKSSWGQTEFDEKVNYQRALEGELERTISTLSDVKSARVHLVMPTPSVFLDRERGAKASVALRMKHGSLPDDQLLAIARLVSGAVDDLKPGDVVIVDAESNQTLGNRSGTAEGHELEAELTQRLLTTLGPAVGVENLRASVNVQIDQSSSEESQDAYDPTVSAVLTTQKSHEQSGSGSSPEGVAGTSANLPVDTPGAASAQDATGAENSLQVTSSENTTFGVNKTTRHIVVPPGRVQRLTAAILVNDFHDRKLVKGEWTSVSRKPTAAQLQQLQQLAESALGTDPKRGDVVTVQNMAFSTDAADDIPPGVSEKLRRSLRNGGDIVRYGAMLLLFVLVWALMVRPVQKQLILSLRELKSGEPSPSTLLHAEAGTSSTLETRPPTVTALPGDEDEIGKVQRRLSELIQNEPAAMTRTLQAWLREDHS
jgi:flagellar M-ring protein FliF